MPIVYADMIELRQSELDRLPRVDGMNNFQVGLIYWTSELSPYQVYMYDQPYLTDELLYVLTRWEVKADTINDDLAAYQDNVSKRVAYVGVNMATTTTPATTTTTIITNKTR